MFALNYFFYVFSLFIYFLSSLECVKKKMISVENETVRMYFYVHMYKNIETSATIGNTKTLTIIILSVENVAEYITRIFKRHQ